MPIPSEGLRAFVVRVGEFHLRDGKMRRAQERMQKLLAGQGEVTQREIAAYLAQTRGYFSAFEREARGHFQDVEKRLAHIGQLQFNLTAERGVAQQRIEATQGVLSALEGLVP